MFSDSDRPQSIVGRLKSRGLKVILAESCTGGLVTKLLTDVPGSSAVVWGGVVAYSNQAKEKILSVPAELIGAQGAVSADTALAMARGALALSACDLAVAITGIAGPDGGSREKPVGTVHIALAAPDGRCDVRNCLFAGTREEIRQASAMKALEIIESFI